MKNAARNNAARTTKKRVKRIERLNKKKTFLEPMASGWGSEPSKSKSHGIGWGST